MHFLQLNTEEEFVGYWENEFRKFQLIRQPFLERWLNNVDHGMPHAGKAWLKSKEIISELQEPIRIEILNIGFALHDSGRAYPSEKKLDNHDQISVWITKRYIRSCKPNMAWHDRYILMDAIVNHDFFNSEIFEYKMMPLSLEGRLLRASDKMSLNIVQEVRRWRDYSKKIGQKLFKPDLAMNFRLEWKPHRIKGLVLEDQLCWFLSLLFALSPKDFLHPIISSKYAEWEKSKQKGVEEIIKIAREEEYSVAEIRQIIDIVGKFKKIKNWQW